MEGEVGDVGELGGLGMGTGASIGDVAETGAIGATGETSVGGIGADPSSGSGSAAAIASGGAISGMASYEGQLADQGNDFTSGQLQTDPNVDYSGQNNSALSSLVGSLATNPNSVASTGFGLTGGLFGASGLALAQSGLMSPEGIPGLGTGRGGSDVGVQKGETPADVANAAMTATGYGITGPAPNDLASFDPLTEHSPMGFGPVTAGQVGLAVPAGFNPQTGLIGTGIPGIAPAQVNLAANLGFGAQHAGGFPGVGGTPAAGGIPAGLSYPGGFDPSNMLSTSAGLVGGLDTTGLLGPDTAVPATGFNPAIDVNSPAMTAPGTSFNVMGFNPTISATSPNIPGFAPIVEQPQVPTPVSIQVPMAVPMPQPDPRGPQQVAVPAPAPVIATPAPARGDRPSISDMAKAGVFGDKAQQIELANTSPGGWGSGLFGGGKGAADVNATNAWPDLTNAYISSQVMQLISDNASTRQQQSSDPWSFLMSAFSPYPNAFR